jgi:hypothetical protein
MASFVGDAVIITVGTGTEAYVVNGQRWTLDTTVDVVETTEGWTAATRARTYGPGWLSATGTWECRVDGTTPLLVPYEGLLGAVFTMAAGRTISYTLSLPDQVGVIITGMSVSAERRGEVTVIYTWQGSGLPVIV